MSGKMRLNYFFAFIIHLRFEIAI